MRTWVLPPASLWIEAAAVSRTMALRPMMASLETPAWASDLDMARPMPAPPPVTTTVLPASESAGRVGEIAGYVDVCHVLV